MADENDKNPYAKREGVRGRFDETGVREEDLMALAKRLVVVEAWLTSRKVQKEYEDRELVRRNAEIDKRMSENRSAVEKLEKSISGSVNKALWIVGGTIITAVIGWMLRGGLGV